MCTEHVYIAWKQCLAFSLLGRAPASIQEIVVSNPSQCEAIVTNGSPCGHFIIVILRPP